MQLFIALLPSIPIFVYVLSTFWSEPKRYDHSSWPRNDHNHSISITLLLIFIMLSGTRYNIFSYIPLCRNNGYMRSENLHSVQPNLLNKTTNFSDLRLDRLIDFFKYKFNRLICVMLISDLSNTGSAFFHGE